MLKGGYTFEKCSVVYHIRAVMTYKRVLRPMKQSLACSLGYGSESQKEKDN